MADEVGSSWPELEVHTLLAALGDGQVDFIVIGGIAAVMHGSPTVTHDLDIVFENGPANRRRLGAVLVALEAKPWGVAEEVPFEADARTLDSIQLLTLETSAGRIDVMHPPAGSPDYAKLRAGAQPVAVDGREILVAGIDDLIAMKRAAGRNKDLAAVDELEAIKRLSD